MTRLLTIGYGAVCYDPNGTLPQLGPAATLRFRRRDSVAGRDRLGLPRRRRHRGDHARCPADFRWWTGQHHEFLHPVVHLQHGCGSPEQADGQGGV